MELFRIGGPNPDTNYLFMGAFCFVGRISPTTNLDIQVIMSTEAIIPSRP